MQETYFRHQRIGITQEVSSFDVEQGKGTRYTIAGRFNWLPIPDLSLRLIVPIHQVWLTGGEHRAGFGDSELRIKGRIVQSGPVQIQLGLIQTLPTGSRTERLGNGATVLTPFVTGGYRIVDTILYLYVSDEVTVRRDNQKHYEDITDPNTDHELQNAVGFIHIFTEELQMNVSFSAITTLTRRDRGQTFLFGGPLLAWGPNDAVHLALGVQLPIAGEKRFDWRGSLDAYVSF